MNNNQSHNLPFSLISRVRKTVRGSADDIGWLQKASGMPPVEDGTKRFKELLDNIRYSSTITPSSVLQKNYFRLVLPKMVTLFILASNFNLFLFDRNGEHKLPNSVVYLLVPGNSCKSFKILLVDKCMILNQGYV